MPNYQATRGQDPKDLNQIAFDAVQKAIGAKPKEPCQEPRGDELGALVGGRLAGPGRKR